LITAVLERTKPETLKAVVVLGLFYSVPDPESDLPVPNGPEMDAGLSARILLDGIYPVRCRFNHPSASSCRNILSIGNLKLWRLLDWIGAAALAVQFLAFIYGLSARGGRKAPYRPESLRLFSVIGLISFAFYVAASYLGPNTDWFQIGMPSYTILCCSLPCYICDAISSNPPGVPGDPGGKG